MSETAYLVARFDAVNGVLVHFDTRIMSEFPGEQMGFDRVQLLVAKSEGRDFQEARRILLGRIGHDRFLAWARGVQ